ncbi:MAG: ribosomal L7Ae/L30e/S12e/Gadd45 family protein [Clostridiales bacterium]|nr:ribosomal L7Ae/L30e/S12e/Gadd45 family protein [Clostridiales bacterium]
MNDKLLGILGLARRAGRLILGFDMVCERIKSGEARLVITASDTSKNTYKSLIRVLDESPCEHIVLCRGKEDISAALGRLTSVMCVTDEGFARKIKELNLQGADNGSKKTEGNGSI